MGRLTLIATALSAVGSGLIGGVFFAFSTSVMRALRDLPPAQGIAAMQGFNTAIVNPRFLLLFVGSTASCLVVAATAPFTDAPSAVWWVAGAAVFLVGAIGVTAVVNVPMNNALAAVDPRSDEGLALWARYLDRWTTANHVRTASALVSAVLLTIGTA